VPPLTSIVRPAGGSGARRGTAPGGGKGSTEARPATAPPPLPLWLQRGARPTFCQQQCRSIALNARPRLLLDLCNCVGVFFRLSTLTAAIAVQRRIPQVFITRLLFMHKLTELAYTFKFYRRI